MAGHPGAYADSRPHALPPGLPPNCLCARKQVQGIGYPTDKGNQGKKQNAQDKKPTVAIKTPSHPDSKSKPPYGMRSSSSTQASYGESEVGADSVADPPLHL